ncbi:MAG TPA: hypothetical protein VM118_01280 [Acidobacteriota bacterium]|nr:hypothetical protein [Acidobacteriota bacterium]
MSLEYLISSVREYPLLSLAGSFVGGLLLAGILWAIRVGRDRRRSDADEMSESEPRFGGVQNLPPVHWLEGDDSPTGRRVLDCRPIALGVQLMTPNTKLLDKFFEVAHGDPDEVAGHSPEKAWLVGVDWTFDFEESEQIAGGMSPQVTEDLWRIDCISNRLYLRRSWTGQLMFMTNFQRVPTDGGRITRIWAPGDDPFSSQSPEYIAAYVRHLVDTHLLNVATPFPIPPDFPEDNQKIAALVFYSVGRRGWLAEYFGGR